MTLYVQETEKEFETAVRDLEDAVKRHKFGVLHTLDLQEKLKEKGVDFPARCRILSICNPQRAAEVLAHDISLNMALPCRVSVYEEDGRVKIGMVRPTTLLDLFPQGEQIRDVAQTVEDEIRQMIQEAG